MVVAAVDEAVADVAVRPDGAPAQDAVLAAVELDGLHRRSGAAGRRLAPRRRRVLDRERDVPDAVPVGADVLGDLAVGGQRRREHDPDVVLLHDVARAVPDAGLEAREGDRREAPQRAEVGRGLAGVAHPELDVVDAVERQEVLGLGERVLVDVGSRLVGDGRAHRARLAGREAVSVMGALRVCRRLPAARARSRMVSGQQRCPCPCGGSSGAEVTPSSSRSRKDADGRIDP